MSDRMRNLSIRAKLTTDELIERLAKDNKGKSINLDVTEKAVRTGALSAAVATGMLSSPASANDNKAPIQIQQVEKSTQQLMLDALAENVQATQDSEQEGTLSGAEWSCLVTNIYHEARGENTQGRMAVALTVLARALDRRFSNTVCGVVFQPKQFSWTFDRRILTKTNKNQADLQTIQNELDNLIKGQRYDVAVILLSTMLGLPEKTLYYKRTDNKGVSERSKKMFAKLTPVGAFGAHTFYTD